MNTKKMLSLFGNEVEIQPWLLNRHKVEDAAGKFFGSKVACIPCVFGHNSVNIGWRCREIKTGKIIGYLSLATGVFCRTEDYEYPINVCVPIEKSVAQVHGNEVFFTGLELALYQSH